MVEEEYKLTADHYVNFIVTLCDALELEDPIFMGSSFGGNVALQLALRRPDRFKGVIPVEGADYSPGFFLDWWRHPHANAAQVCASGVVGPDGAAVAGDGPLDDLALLHPGSEAFKGDLYFYSVDHDLRAQARGHRRRRCPVVMMTGTTTT